MSLSSRGPAVARLAAFLVNTLFLTGVALAAQAGQPLHDALDELTRSGLQIVYSTALVPDDLRVVADVRAGSLEQQARRILEPHGLTLEPVRAGVFVVVRRAVATPGSDRVPTTPAEPLAEISVFASRYTLDLRGSDITLAQYSRDDLEALPSLHEDALRALQFLPGTASTPLSSRVHVRGGRDNELGVYFDGVPLF